MKSIAFIFSLAMLTIAAAAYSEGLSPQDYMEIQQLYAHYNKAIDSGDAEAYAATFTPDGVFNTYNGHDELVGFINRYVETMNGKLRRHWNTNLVIDGDGKTANGFVYLMMLDLTQQPPAISTTATYTDLLVKTKDGWRFTKRMTTADRPREVAPKKE